MTVRFYDVGQGLAALVELPDNRVILVDTGDNPARSEEQCHGACAAWHQRLMSDLGRDLAGRPIELLWITHQHSDHLGGAVDVLEHFQVSHLVDNGEEPKKEEVVRLHRAAASRGVPVMVVAPGKTALPIEGSPSVRLSAVVPTAWPHDCTKEPNDCSIGLRIDDCSSSVLFVGDAEKSEEGVLAPLAPVTLLQVGHHGSDTSSSVAFLDRVQPKYAVISAAKKGEGTNEEYCHPRRSVIDRLTSRTGGPGAGAVTSFDGSKGCGKKTEAEHWQETPGSAHLWITARDGDVVLSTTGDGVFTRK